MCGLIGVVSFANHNRNTVRQKELASYFRDAAMAGTVRGTDGFGVFQADVDRAKNSFYTHKTADHGLDHVLLQKRTTSIIDDAGYYKFTVGHHRAATFGKVTDKNAHPFQVLTPRGDTKLIGVHNGSLTGWQGHEDAKNHEVDSSWLMARIAENRDEALAKINGAAALMWVNFVEEPEALNLFTNGQRPLHFANVATGNERPTFIIASEPAMLAWLAARNSLAIKENKILRCKPNRLYRMHKDAEGGFEILDIKPEPTSYYSNWHGRGRSRYAGSATQGAWSSTRDQMEKIVQEVLGESATIEETATPLLPAPAGSSKVTTRPPHTSPEEQNLLKPTFGFNPGSEGVFEGILFEPSPDDPLKGDLRGTVWSANDNGESVELEAIVRGVTKSFSDMWVDGVLGVVKMLGVCKETNIGNMPVSMTIVCSHPREFVNSDRGG